MTRTLARAYTCVALVALGDASARRLEVRLDPIRSVHGPGLDDWIRAAADQLAGEGFIAVAPDVWSGLGPGGGGREAFRYPDEAIRAAAGKLTAEGTLRRYRAAWKHALTLSRSTGSGGTTASARAAHGAPASAGEVPDIRAAVVSYSAPPEPAVMARIKAPVLGLYGQDDPRVTSTLAPAAARDDTAGEDIRDARLPRRDARHPRVPGRRTQGRRDDRRAAQSHGVPAPSPAMSRAPELT
jgi:hypothetical protein